MNILYIGGANILAKSIINNIAKEDNQIFIVSENDFQKELKPNLKYRYYKLSDEVTLNDTIFYSINPEIVIFTGENYLKCIWDIYEAKKYSVHATYWINKCTDNNKKLIFLSTAQVYEQEYKIIDEKSNIGPTTLKGITIAQGENLVKLYQKNRYLHSTILRCDDIYGDKCSKLWEDYVSNILNDIDIGKKITIGNNEKSQMIYADDVVEIIKIIMVNSKYDKVYNVCSKERYELSDIIDKIAQKANKKANIEIIEKTKTCEINSDLAHVELEWTDIKDLERFIISDRFNIINVKETHIKKHHKKDVLPAIRKTIENLVIFAFFFIITLLCKDNVLFSSIDFMLMYVVIIAMSYGIYQSTISITLASIVYLYFEDISILNMINFYAHVGSIIKIIEYIFSGILISYTTDSLKEEIRQSKLKEETAIKEKNEIIDINKENVFIKNEYSRRLLDAKNSLPQLHAIINKISVLQPEKIFVEIISVVASIMETNTVSVYATKKNSSYVRLLSSLNEKSIYMGKSWNLKDTPKVMDKISKGEVFNGSKWENEPALIAPIMSDGECIALVVITEMSFEKQTLYHINLLRTLSILIAEAITKAKQYEEMTKDIRYIENTNILYCEEFEKLVKTAYEKKRQDMGECCVIKCAKNTEILEIYEKIKTLVRDTDAIGEDYEDALCVLLGNNSIEDGKFIIKRFAEHGVNAIITDEYEKI